MSENDSTVAAPVLERWRERLFAAAAELRFASRRLRRAQGFAVTTTLTLALGIGSISAVLSVVYAVLLSPLPVRDAHRVLALWADNPSHQPAHIPLDWQELQAFARETRTLSQVAAVDYHGTLPRLVQFGDTVASIPAALVTGGFFDVLGAKPLLGRLLRPEDDRYGAPFVAVISERLWRSAYGADPHVIGRRTRFYLRDMTIVGVVAGALDFPRGAEMWASYPNYVQARDTLPWYAFFDVVGRLAPGASPSVTQQELGAFLARPDEPHSGARKLLGNSLRPVVQPIRDVIVGDVRPLLRVVLGAVALLLLVTCINVAGLMLVQTLARRRELAVRAALGASRRRLGILGLADSAVLGTLASTLGMAAAWYAVRVFAAFAPPEIPRGHEIQLNVPVLAATVIVGAVIVIALACIPALIGARARILDALADRSGGSSRHAHRVRALLVGSQVAASVAVLAAAGVLLRSFDSLAHRGLGFRPDHLIVARFGQTHSVGDLRAWQDVLARIVGDVRQVPGVEHATGLLQPPFREAGNDLAYSLPGDVPGAPTARPLVDYLGADPDYFATMGIPLKRGRTFSDGDRDGAPRVAVVDELLARQAWPGEDPIGKQIGVGTTFYTVVGVVASTRYRDLLAPRATLYTPWAQSALSPQEIAIRTRGNPQTIIPAVREVVREADGRVYLADLTTMSARIDVSLAAQRLAAILLGAFATAILLLTGVGLYGVSAAFVRQRKRELGVRLALGATPAEAGRLVVRQGAMVVVIGTGAGLVLALAGGRVLRSVIYGVSARDPLALAAAVLAVLFVAVLALVLPALRASRVDPALALREE